MNGVVKAYLECALWLTDDDPGIGEWGEHEPWTIGNFDPASLEGATQDCAAFEAQARKIDPEHSHWTDAQLGHDFWLTRNRHGAGFWDRDFGTPEMRASLTALAQAYGEVDCYLGDDGKVHLS